ncbi:site-2 protease family protein [Flavobacterium poyangense]|uniref:site-2 protease family protein n=1 Tax=Flavobacterium poyangense TaxID=2204302 RepID=UPI001AB0600E|nr:site-2 protease family protein [Flavobacterium sp. JXAS1]
MKYNTSITIDFAYDFLYNKLAKFGIIESDIAVVQQNPKPNYLKLSFVLLNEKGVSVFTDSLQMFFQREVLNTIIGIFFLAVGVCFYLFDSQIFHVGISKSEWFLYFVLSFIGVIFHELGHASAAHYYGAKHGGIGAGFYLFMPVFFSDVTDIWKLSVRQRIVVNIAGIYFELIYAVFLFLIGLLTNYEHLVTFFFIFSISSFRNLNPFARSDGYWILSDTMEIPNLMAQALLKIKQFLRFKNNNWGIKDYFLLVYGLLNYTLILFFFYFLVVENPDSILYFPYNVVKFIQNLFADSGTFSITDFAKLLMPMFFFYLVIGLVKKIVTMLFFKIKERLHTSVKD